MASIVDSNALMWHTLVGNCAVSVASQTCVPRTCVEAKVECPVLFKILSY